MGKFYPVPTREGLSFYPKWGKPSGMCVREVISTLGDIGTFGASVVAVVAYWQSLQTAQDQKAADAEARRREELEKLRREAKDTFLALAGQGWPHVQHHARKFAERGLPPDEVAELVWYAGVASGQDRIDRADRRRLEILEFLERELSSQA